MEAATTTAGAGPSTITFGDVVIDVDSYALSRAGESVAVEPQVFDVLHYLITHRDRVVGKIELFDNIWGDRFVSESALTSRIKSARRAVGDDGRRQEVIRTTHGRGYRFVAELSEAAIATDSAGVAADEPVESAPTSTTVPAPARQLIARERELARLVTLLQANRLVTVVGPGGVGKTRLVTELATRWDHDFDDAVTFVSLATVSGPGEVFVAVREALGIATGDSGAAFGAVVDAFAGKSVLLVLDNFEHVVDAAGQLIDLVESVPGVRLLVTSRERLGLTDEHVVELAPLAIDLDGSTDDLTSAAVTFFEHSLRGVGSGIEPDADQREDIIAICRTLDGLPLAMELAAAQTRYFSLTYLRGHLESQAITVADRARDRPERHHTMHSTIDWSYRLLTPSQQQLLCFLAVYKGSWPLAAADATGTANEVGAATQDLLALVDKSLIQRSDGLLGEPRFSMLHLLNEYAAAELHESGNRDEALDRHATFISQTVRDLEARRWSDTGDEWLDAIGFEYADVIAALTWCFGDGDAEIGCQIVRALGFWWYRSGRHRDGRMWVDQSLANMSEVDDSTRAWIHSAAGTLAEYGLQPVESQEHFRIALDLASQTGDERLEAISLCHIGAAAATLGEAESGLNSLNLGLELSRKLESPQLIAHALTVLGELSRANGQPDRAEEAYSEALDLNLQIGNRHYQAINTLNMAHALTAQDRMLEALPYYRRGLELSSRNGSRIQMAWNLSGLATARHRVGDFELAAQLIGAVEETFELLGANCGPVDQPVREQTMLALRNDLGDKDYERLVNEGRELGLEACISIALDTPDQAD